MDPAPRRESPDLQLLEQLHELPATRPLDLGSPVVRALSCLDDEAKAGLRLVIESLRAAARDRERLRSERVTAALEASLRERRAELLARRAAAGPEPPRPVGPSQPEPAQDDGARRRETTSEQARHKPAAATRDANLEMLRRLQNA